MLHLNDCQNPDTHSNDFDAALHAVMAIRRFRRRVIGSTIAAYVGAMFIWAAISTADTIDLLGPMVCALLLLFAALAVFSSHTHCVNEYPAICILARTCDKRAIVPAVSFLAKLMRGPNSQVHMRAVGDAISDTLMLIGPEDEALLPDRERSVLRRIIQTYPHGPWESEHKEVQIDRFTRSVVHALSELQDTESIRAIRHVEERAVNPALIQTCASALGSLGALHKTRDVLLRPSIAGGESDVLVRPAAATGSDVDLLRPGSE